VAVIRLRPRPSHELEVVANRGGARRATRTESVWETELVRQPPNGSS